MNPAAWYSGPENELLRREIVWTRRWLFRGPGLKWLLLFLLISFTGVLGWIVQFGMWYHLLQKRTLEFFRKERLQDLLMTRLDGQNLWPALIAAPVFAALVLGIISAVMKFAFVMVLHHVDFISLYPSASGISGEFALPESSKFELMAQAAASGIIGMFQWVAVTAFAARSMLPKGGGLSMVIAFIVGWVLLKLPEFALYLVMTNNWIGSTLGTQITQPVAIWGPLALGVLAAWLVYTFSIGSLRGARFRRQLERLSQSGS